jgi:hypothetical protein
MSAIAAPFQSGYTLAGYMLGGAFTFVGLLVSWSVPPTFCIPSLIYRTIFGFPPKSGSGKA